MKYVLVPSPVEVVDRKGERVREEPRLDPETRQVVPGAVMAAVSLFAYAEVWWISEKLVTGGVKKLRQAEKIIAAFDQAKADHAAFVALEDADWECLKAVCEERPYFRQAPLELQVLRFPQAVLDAKSELPAALLPPKQEPAAAPEEKPS